MGLFDDFQASAQRGINLVKDPKAALNPQSIAGGGTSTLPWQNQADKFWPPAFIDGDRWDKIYPYRLLVIDVENGNQIVGANSGDDAIDVRVQVDSASIVAEPVNQWEFRLPLTPEQISVTDQYAINTSATFRGILEEHNGVKFKMISAQGTTGIWPNRAANAASSIGNSGISSFLSNTLGAVQNLASQVTKVVNAVQGKPPYSAPAAPNVPTDQTGYYQAQLLGQFLEQYAMAKKDSANKGWRLVFDNAKDNQAYIVTPISFSLNKSSQRPGLYMWSFQLKAWKRADLSRTLQQITPSTTPLDSNTFKNILNALSDARQAVQGALSLIAAVRSDIEGPLTILRQATLLVKDLAGVPQAVAELPNQIVSDYTSAIMQNAALLQSIGTSSTSASVQAKVASLQSAVQGNEGVSIKAVQGGNLGTARSNATASDPAFNIFNSPETAYDLFSQINLADLTLTDQQKAAFQTEVDNVRLYTVNDLKQQRLQLRDLALDIANRYGAGGATLYDIYGRAAPTVTSTQMTIEQAEILEHLWNAIQAFDTLTATTFLDQSKVLNPLQYVGNLAKANGVEFNASSTSKVLVPVPFGLSIEQIASRYLGDQNRYIEIATLNFLREPYIDEDGFTYSLLSNGQGRQITVSSNENLYIGQNVILSSTTVAPFTRNITDVQQIDDSTFLVTFDGTPDLDSLLTANSAQMKAYLPGTVNSQDQIYIPTDLPADPDDQIQLPAGVMASSIVGLSKVDILLTDQMDVAIDAQGDFRYSAGLTNLIQALKIKFSTERGSILAHPTFGIDAQPGTMTSDLNVKELYKQINTMISNDSRFTGVAQMQIRLNGPTLEISLLVGLRNQTGVVPITFSLSSASGQPTSS